MSKQADWMEQYRRYVGLLWDHRWWVLGVWIGVLVLSAAIAVLLPDSYNSTTTILVERQKIPEDYVRSTVTETMQERLRTISQQILSRTRIRQIIDEYNLVNEITFTERILARLHLLEVPAVKEWGRRLDLLRDPNAPPNFDAAINTFQKKVKVDVVGEQAFSVQYTGYDPVTVMRVANAIADMFITENLKLREARAEGTTEFLNSQLESARKDLEQQEAAVQNFKAKNLGALPEQLDANLRTLDRLQLELQHVDESLAGQVEQKTFVQRQLLSVEQQIADMSAEARAALRKEGPLERQLAESEARLDQLRAKYTDKFPEVATLMAQVADLKAKIAERRADDAAPADLGTIPVLKDLRDQLRQVEQESAELRTNRDRLEKDLANYKHRVESTPGVESQLQKLSRDYGNMQTNYQSLLSKQMNAKLSESLERRQKGEQFLIIDPANLPTIPDSPNRVRILLAGLVGGLAAGAGVVIGLDQMRPRFRTREDVTALLGLPVLGAVPQIKGIERGS